MGKIAVIILKKYTVADVLKMTDAEVDLHSNFKRMSAIEKIELIKEKIKNTCDMLAKIEPNSMWIIVWHEHMIDDGQNKRAIGIEEKSLLKKTMLDLTQEFSPHLTIIAGSTSTKKQFNDSNLDKLNKIKTSYASLKWVAEIEESRVIKHGVDQLQIKEELKNIEKIENDLPFSYYVLRNTCYIFHGDKIYRHDKIVPSQETFFNQGANLDYAMFQPANNKNINPTFSLIHPFTQQIIPIGIEICREHVFGILKNQVKQNPLLQFIISNTISFNSGYQCGKFAFHVDSVKPTKFICASDKSNDEFEICAYNYLIDSTNSQLELLPSQFIESQKMGLKN